MKNAKKSLVFVVTQAEWGGAQHYVFKAAQEALRRGYDVLVTAGGEGSLQTHCTEANIPYQALKQLKREIHPLADIKATHELVLLFKKQKPDTVFLFSAKAGIVGTIAGRLAGVKRIVYRIGGWSWLDPVSERQKLIRIWSERITAPLKDIIIVQHPGDEQEARQKKIQPRKKIVVISNGLDISSFDQTLLPKNEARNILKTLSDKTGTEETNTPTQFILSIASFYATKDIPNLLKAADIVRRKRSDAHFVVIGKNGDDQHRVHETMRQLNLESTVTLATFPHSDSKAQTLLPGADLFVSSSAKEGNPWTLHEAMAARIPCIATDVGACAWLLQNDAGWIVPPKNPEALAEAILYALDHPEEARKRSDQARQNIETKFTEATMWEQTFKTLEE